MEHKWNDCLNHRGTEKQRYTEKVPVILTGAMSLLLKKDAKSFTVQVSDTTMTLQRTTAGSQKIKHQCPKSENKNPCSRIILK
jgi:hypothetical protein